jgi:hypothetical protein
MRSNARANSFNANQQLACWHRLCLTLAGSRWQPNFVNLQQFRESLNGDQPPRKLSLALAGLWWDAKGDWVRAHESAQQDEGPSGAWVHAYLHRKEGDSSNAAYWYRRAGKCPARHSLEQEWLDIAGSLLLNSE